MQTNISTFGANKSKLKTNYLLFFVVDEPDLQHFFSPPWQDFVEEFEHAFVDLEPQFFVVLEQDFVVQSDSWRFEQSVIFFFPNINSPFCSVLRNYCVSFFLFYRIFHKENFAKFVWSQKFVCYFKIFLIF